ncbi:MAG: toll/interleukin-1 receptor domain-containing protein [Clostridia bacterium]|nr:toll/interleukin-1 receptor domain-containing protein [Clostridia bacterium]
MSIYEGKKNYVFISYAHKDSEVVLPIVNAMMENGYRVWYDQGIEAGTEWPAYIEEHLMNCERAIIFISQNSVDSINCRNEINLAATENKEMLVVYLEETKLKHGLSLQLGARQSLFRARHESDEQFVNELLNAKILQCCREGGEDFDGELISTSIALPPMQRGTQNGVAVTNDFNNSEYYYTLQERAHGPSLISRVGAMGSNNPNVPWPVGNYSQTISTSLFSAVHFHCSLLHPVQTEGAKKVGIRIFDDRDIVVFENQAEFTFKPGNQRFSLTWVIKESNGFAQTPGNYSALIWIDDSRAYEFNFRITETAPAQSTEQTIENTLALRASLKKEMEELEKKTAFPKLALLQAIVWAIAIFMIKNLTDFAQNIDYMVTSLDMSTPFTMVGLGLVAFILTICIFKTAKKVIPNGFVRFLLVFFLGTYFGIYLVIMGLINLGSLSKNKQRLKEIKLML